MEKDTVNTNRAGIGRAGSNFLFKEKLRKTDWLIDQIVYRLYGLTGEEIKNVEGSGSF